jgi:ankyrin repeat protein
MTPEEQRQVAELLQEAEGRAFHGAVLAGDVDGTRRLLESSAFVQARINVPAFAFGQRALHVATGSTEMLELLLSFGADLELRSAWQNGPYTVLDRCDEPAARFLLQRGARLTANVASRLGWFNELRDIVERDPSSVHERGGDGQQALHQAKTVDIADYLIDHGAGIDVPCIDHRSTPAQYALTERTDVCRRLLARGAAPDIFMAAHIGDIEMADRLIDDDRSCLAARINAAGYARVPPFNIYCWTLGFNKSPHEVALDAGQHRMYERLVERSSPHIRFIEAACRGDERGAREAMTADSSLPASLTEGEHGALAHAIHHSRFDAAAVMLRLGFDPRAPGVDGGTALHQAGWVGHVATIEALVKDGRVPINGRDPTHDGTPLGWAAFGSVHRCAEGSDYIKVIERLIAAGAVVDAHVLASAEGNTLVQETLRKHLTSS